MLRMMPEPASDQGMDVGWRRGEKSTAELHESERGSTRFGSVFRGFAELFSEIWCGEFWKKCFDWIFPVRPPFSPARTTLRTHLRLFLEARRSKMAASARTTSALVAQLAGSFRQAITIGSKGHPVATNQHLRQAASSRAFQTSTAFASSSSSFSSSTSNEPSGRRAGSGRPVGSKDAKAKRHRRTKEEVEAARMAKLAFDIPMRGQKRTRTSVGGVAQPYNESEEIDADDRPKKRIGRPPNPKPETTEADKVKLAKQRRVSAAEEAPSLAEELLQPGTMERLLSEMVYDHLPPRDEWKTAFPNAKQALTTYRYFVANRSTVKSIIPHLGLNEPERNGEKVTIIEGYPGPGTFASELLKLDEVEKLIALEATPCYLKKIELLKSQLEAQNPGSGQRLETLKSSAYLWETYNTLISSGKLAHLNNRIPKSDGTFVDFTTNDFAPPAHTDESWQKLSPILFFAQLPNTVYGEQLFAQIITAIASRIWLFRHGRIKLGLICGESLAKRCLAEAGDKVNRGKLGTTVQCLADVEVHKYAHELQPHGSHFFPPTISIGPRVTVSGTSLIPNSNPSTGLTRTGMVMMTVTPKKAPLVNATEIEAFEFITRNLFILRKKPVEEALTHVAPGANNLLKMTSREQVARGLIREDEVIEPGEIVSGLTNAQWACLARMFEKWPFRPRHLFEEGRLKPQGKSFG